MAECAQGTRSVDHQGRGSVIDPSPMLEQYFEFGVTPRIGYSNPQLDDLLRAERREFDPARRKSLLLQAFNIIAEDVPAFFLWRIDAILRHLRQGGVQAALG